MCLKEEKVAEIAGWDCKLNGPMGTPLRFPPAGIPS
jgi:hypothetical protein